MSRLKKVFFVLVLMAAGLLLFYWFKCQLGVDVIPGFAWEADFPMLNGLQKRDYLIRPRPGDLLLRSTFDEAFPFLPWGTFWVREKGLAQDLIVGDGVGGSKCLMIRNQSAKDWALPASTAYEVNPGDIFSFEGYGRTAGFNQANISIILYDENKSVLKWIFAAEVMNGAQWKKHERRFTVPDGVRYIRLQLMGSGVGEVYYDDIKFTREL